MGSIMKVDNIEMENIVGEVVDCFEEKMKLLFEENPEMIEPQEEIRGVTKENLWKMQVTNCGLDLLTDLDDLIAKYETKIKSGEYYEEYCNWLEEAGVKAS
jgi:hypothetical protein